MSKLSNRNTHLKKMFIGNHSRTLRAMWNIIWFLFFRPSPVFAWPWRRAILRCFGARIGRGAHPYPSCRIWAPWNLEMDEGSCLGPNSICYNPAPITLGCKSTVSQWAHLCSASHDIDMPGAPLISAPIVISEHAWIFANAFIGPGVTVGIGGVVGAMSMITKDIPAWEVHAGNPARKIRDRKHDDHMISTNGPPLK